MTQHTVRPDADTREKLLQAACVAFADKGFRETTIADICDRAGANIAAVNYYFRSKDNLYVEAWRRAFHRSLATYPPDGGVPPGAPPEARLGGRIRSVLRRIADPESREFDIVQKELASPTGLLGKMAEECIEPLRREVTTIVAELLGPRAARRHVELCRTSIMAQCFGPMLRERQRKLLPAGSLPGPDLPETDAGLLADHILRFSLAGIREIRRQLESGELADAAPADAAPADAGEAAHA